MTSTQTNSLPIVIVDTNVLGNLLDKKTFTKTTDILVELGKKYHLSVSKITIQEIVSKGTKDVEVILNLLTKIFEMFDIDENVLKYAGLMNFAGVRGQYDSIIASTTFLNNATLLTANQRDFPEPIFSEVDCWNIQYKDKENRTTNHTIYLLVINPEQAAKKFNSIEYFKEFLNKI